MKKIGYMPLNRGIMGQETGPQKDQLQLVHNWSFLFLANWQLQSSCDQLWSIQLPVFAPVANQKMWDLNFLVKSGGFRQIPVEFTRVCWSSPATSGRGDTAPPVLTSMRPMNQLLQHLLQFPRPLDVPSVQQLFQFMNVAFTLKEEIILTLPSMHHHKDPPTCLPLTVMQFLAADCHLTDDKISGAWTLFKHAV